MESNRHNRRQARACVDEGTHQLHRDRTDSCCHVAATRDEISGDEEGPTGTTARRSHAWSLQVRELFEFSRHVDPGSNPLVLVGALGEELGAPDVRPEVR